MLSDALSTVTLLPWWPLLQTWACPYVSLCSSTWDWWLGPLPRSPGMGEDGDWWSWPMGVIAKGIPRGCQGLSTPVSLGNPLSVVNTKLYSQSNPRFRKKLLTIKKYRFNKTCIRNYESHVQLEHVSLSGLGTVKCVTELAQVWSFWFGCPGINPPAQHLLQVPPTCTSESA